MSRIVFLFPFLMLCIATHIAKLKFCKIISLTNLHWCLTCSYFNQVQSIFLLLMFLFFFKCSSMLTEGKDLLVLTTEKPLAKYYLVSATPTMTARGKQFPIYSDCSEWAHFSWTGLFLLALLGFFLQLEQCCVFHWNLISLKCDFLWINDVVN